MEDSLVKQKIKESLDRRAEAPEVCLTVWKHNCICRKLKSYDALYGLSDPFVRPESYTGSHLVLVLGSVILTKECV
jgi:hypothetical protein